MNLDDSNRLHAVVQALEIRLIKKRIRTNSVPRRSMS